MLGINLDEGGSPYSLGEHFLGFVDMPTEDILEAKELSKFGTHPYP